MEIYRKMNITDVGYRAEGNGLEEEKMVFPCCQDFIIYVTENGISCETLTRADVLRGKNIPSE